MIKLREQIEKDLRESLEREWKVDIELTSPDGDVQVYSKNNPSEKLGGQILYFTKATDPVTGESIIVHQPVAVIRISSLDRIPQSGENWYIKMPTRPGGVKESFVFTGDKAIEDGTDIGFIRIYPQRIKRSEVVS